MNEHGRSLSLSHRSIIDDNELVNIQEANKGVSCTMDVKAMPVCISLFDKTMQ
jgi:hypothetical protein